MGKQTPLYQQHQAAGAKIVDFAGWDMPLHYGSQLEEHHQVRRDAGVFDVSHMRAVDVSGPDAQAFLRHLLANDVARLKLPGKALYSCMLNDEAGVVDDLIAYYLAPGRYRLVVNAGTADKDLAWMRANVQGQVEIRSREDLAILAVQGPKARERVLALLTSARREAAAALEPFFGAEADGWFIGRTGYTGEDGFELMVPAAEAATLWQRLLDAGVAPVGLGARDTLRLEAGMNLYGQDMDDGTTPLESGLGWTVAWEPAERHFIGRPALEVERTAGSRLKLVGLVLEERGVLRSHMPVHTDQGAGETTSGSFAPTLGGSIALARVPTTAGAACEVEIRGKRLKARVVKLPFVRHGKVLV